MKYLIVLTAVFACALSASHTPKWVLPRLPLSVILGGKAVAYDANDPKIVGGTDVEPNSLPFQISLQRLNGLGNFAQSCGGSILAANIVLNAAHCVDGVTDTSIWQVVAGEHSLRADSGKEQYSGVSSYKQHERYNSGTYENDISLIFLTNPFDLSKPEAKAVNLPRPTSEFDPPAGTIVTVSGWGTTSSGGSISDTLKSVNVPVVDDAKCNELYATVVNPNPIKASMLCAGDTNNGGEDSCQGDSGGPLFTSDATNGFVQHGIVSWGRGCAAAAYPGVYTQVSDFLDWIAANRG